MPKKFLNGVVIFSCLSFLAGCSATKDIKVRSYKQDKKRVDQVVEGAVGNWENAPQATSRQIKETRKVYFLEFIKEPPAEPNLNYFTDDLKTDDSESQPEQSSTDQPGQNNFASTAANPGSQRQDSSQTSRKIDLPSFDESYTEEVEDEDNSQRFVDYKVTKNDTLQKISKKFYDSYSKWPRIYEANKDVLKSPDVLTPGINLKIPVD